MSVCVCVCVVEFVRQQNRRLPQPPHHLPYHLLVTLWFIRVKGDWRSRRLIVNNMLAVLAAVLVEKGERKNKRSDEQLKET